MPKVIFLLSLLVMLPGLVAAQPDVPPVEVFGGYSYLRTGSGYDQDSHGWNASVAVNFARHLAVKGDFAGHYDAYDLNKARVNTQLYTFLFGPQVSLRTTERVNPYLHALFGIGHDILKVKIANTKLDYADTGFGMAVGGGVDVKLNDNLSWRLFQSDYLLTRYQDAQVFPLRKRNVHHFRISTGLVFH